MNILSDWSEAFGAHISRFGAHYAGWALGVTALSIFLVFFGILVSLALGGVGFAIGMAMDAQDMAALLALALGGGSFAACTLMMMMIFVPLQIGFFKMIQAGMRGEEASPRLLLSGFRQLVPGVIHAILYSAVVTTAMMLCFFPMFLVLPLCLFGFPAIAERELGPVDALRLSFTLGRSHYLPLLVLYGALFFVTMIISNVPLIGPLVVTALWPAITMTIYADLVQRESVQIKLEAAGLLT